MAFGQGNYPAKGGRRQSHTGRGRGVGVRQAPTIMRGTEITWAFLCAQRHLTQQLRPAVAGNLNR